MMKTHTRMREVENPKTTEVRGKDPASQSSRGGPCFKSSKEFEGRTLLHRSVDLVQHNLIKMSANQTQCCRIGSGSSQSDG